LNGKSLFSGRDQYGQQGLWATDGTAAGTIELGPISGAAFSSSSFPAHPQLDIQPRYMAALGSKVIFDGVDHVDTDGALWVTDGTINGTTEVGGQGNQSVAGSPFTDPAGDPPIGMHPNDITTFSTIGKVIFAAFDSTALPNGHYVRTDALWVSDGTAGGTTEIGGLGNAGIANANTAQNGGLFWNGSVEYPDFTEYNGKVLFAGKDSSASTHIGLWVTDGTANGTVEIGGLGNSGISGGLSLVDSRSPDFTLYNGEVLFNGIDGTGKSGLWVTDGTASGTHELATPDLGSPLAPLGPNFTVAGEPVRDFNGDSSSDVLWRNTTTGEVDTWLVNNGRMNGGTGVGSASSVWQALGTGDFNGDGIGDILWHNNNTGEIDTWLINNGHVSGGTGIGSVSSAWQFVGIGDFNGDGTSDIVWRNTATGEVDTWLMNNGHVSGGSAIGNASSAWQALGTGDFNNDGTTD
jgi:hypothetical protein